jgi:hypothetical protein
MISRTLVGAAVCLLAAAPLRANPPEAQYLFPAGGQRGTKFQVKLGGVFLYKECPWEVLGPGVTAGPRLKSVPTRWFEGPLLPIPESQRAEDYPKDLAGEIAIAKDAALGFRYARVWNSQGATPSLKFVVGDLPEVVEEEIDGDPVPVRVTPPVTINGRIFPRGNIDEWAFEATKGQTVRCEVMAARLGSPLDARLEVLGPDGKRLGENDDTFGADPLVAFTALADGVYRVRITDTRAEGGQAFVYRLTITTGPHVDSVFPLGGKRGSKVAVHLTGQSVPAAPQEILLPADKSPDFLHTFEIAGQRTNVVRLELDDLPEHIVVAKEPIALPAVLNGRIAKPGQVDAWIWTATKGETFEFDLRAARLGSPLDGVLTLHDAAGKEVARAEATVAQPDPSLVFTVPADGTYTVRVQDRLRSRGGAAFAYRLRVAPPQPDFQLSLAADAVTVPRGGQGKLKVQCDRLGGFKEPITLTVTGLPDGVTAAPAALAPGQAAAEITLKADATSRIATARLTVKGTAKVGERTAAARGPRGEWTPDTVLVAVALPTPFKIKGVYDMGFAARGGPHQRVYKIERNGYDGPIEVSLADKQARHLQGVTGPTITVPAGATEFTYTAQLPPWMELGRTCRVCVMGVATVKDQGASEHVVSFSSVNQNEQLVAVVGPGKLALELDRAAVAVAKDKPAVLTVTVKRAADLTGPVRVEMVLPAHVHGLTAEATVIPAGKDRGELRLVVADGWRGPPNMPLTVRATVLHEGHAVVAEAKVEVVE